MTQNERLRALLAEAREWIPSPRQEFLGDLPDDPRGELLQSIEAALAEPGDVHPSHLTDVMTLLENDLDEARAEVEHWKAAAKQHAENHVAAVEAFHDASRLRSIIQQARIKAEEERDASRAEVERLRALLDGVVGACKYACRRDSHCGVCAIALQGINP